MPRFLTGDELGNIKSFRYSPSDGKSDVATLRDGSETGKLRSVQRMTVAASGSKLVATAHADGSVSAYRLEEDNLELLREWREPRLRPGQRYTGLAAADSGVYSCTSNGALRLTSLAENETASTSRTAVLPMRLADWRLAPDEKAFAYCGDEVELSVWDAETAFAASKSGAGSIAADSTKKRKRSQQDLLPGEMWRAKNVANDALSLRQPVNNTCLAFSSPSQRHLVVGTQLGDVRKYDTRAARRPVANWAVKETAKIGGIRAVENGFHDHEIFVADNGSNLFALDTRTGRVVYGYKGLAGAVTSIAPSPSVMVSTSLDRYIRVHSAFPPVEPGQQQDHKGEVREKVYVKSVPTAVVWDQVLDAEDLRPRADNDDGSEDDDEVWEGMEEAEDDE
ncbi:hypothetical protein BV25DRAFT_1781958, partial [Artomyces pyxidatus]